MLNLKLSLDCLVCLHVFQYLYVLDYQKEVENQSNFFLSFRLCEEIREKWDVAKIIIHHRLGEVEITQPSVIIAISAPHRKESLEVHTKFKGLKSCQELQQQPPPGLSLIDICYCVLSENLSKRPGEISLLNVATTNTKNKKLYYILHTYYINYKGI